MSPLSRGIFIIVSAAAEWVSCFILSGIQMPPSHLLAVLIRLLERDERGEEEGTLS